MANSRETFIVHGVASDDELAAVQDEIRELDGVQNVDVDSESREVTVRYDEELLSGEAIKNAARDQGYEVD